MQPTRRLREAGIVERIDPTTGRRLGLEVQFKDGGGTARRRALPGGKRATVHAARDLLAQVRTRRVRAEPEAPDVRMTVDALLDRFEREYVPGLRANSRSIYAGALPRVRAALGRRRVTSVGRSDVRALIAAERAVGLRAHTIYLHLSCARRAWRFAREDLGIPARFPMPPRAELPDPEADRKERRVLSDEELVRVLDACPARSRLLFATIAETGMRISEALGLQARDIGDGTVTLRKQLGRGGSLQPLKSSKRQPVRLIQVRGALSAELRLAAAGGRVFRISHSIASRDWRLAVDRARLDEPRPTPHSLRHTHASKLIRLNWDPREIAERLGHTVQVLLDTYCHEFAERQRGAERRADLERAYGERPSLNSQMGNDTRSGVVQFPRPS